MPRPTKLEQIEVDIDRCVALRRNPQYLTPHQMEALKASIRRDGFLAPVLLRPMPNDDYEVLSGNHRVMAARELDLKAVPALVGRFSNAAAQRIAVNLNTVHGEPTPELLVPFLAGLDIPTLTTIHLSDEMVRAVSNLDEHLAERFASMNVPSSWNNDSVNSPVARCVCVTCGASHIRKTNDSV